MTGRPVRARSAVNRKSWADEIVMTNDIDNIKLSLLLKGGPGVGKTMLMGSAPKPFIIDSETGLLTLCKHAIPSYPLGKKAKGRYYDTTMAILDAIENNEQIGNINFAEIETVCLDSISKLNELLLMDIMTADGVDKAERDHWGYLNNQISAIMNRFIQLDKHRIVSVGEATKTDKNENEYKTLNMRGSYKDFVEHEFDFVIWMNKEAGSRGGTTYYSTGENMQGRSGKMRAVQLEKKMLNPAFDYIMGEVEKQILKDEKPTLKEEKIDLNKDLET